MAAEVEALARSGFEQTATAGGQPLPWAVPALVVTAWAVLVGAEVAGVRLMDHDAIFEGGQGTPAGLVRYFLGWQLMVAATMLPASFAAIRHVAARDKGVGWFLAGFGAVWTVFAWAALSLDSVVHRTVDQHEWLAARPYLVGAGLLLAAGTWQLTPVVRQCLTRRQSWAPRQRADRSRRDRLADGVRYGRLCLADDGAFMLLMFAVGGSVAWSALLGLGVVAQRNAPPNGAARHWFGAAMLLLAVAVVVGSWR